jgi:hypothetical protein
VVRAGTFERVRAATISAQTPRSNVPSREMPTLIRRPLN